MLFFRLSSHSDKLRLPEGHRAGFHRGQDAIFMNFSHIPAADWLLVLVHELIHFADQKLRSAVVQFNALKPQVLSALNKDSLTLTDRGKITAWLEAGLSLYPLPAYAVLWLGRRWRAINAETTRDPGDEFMLLAEFGVTSLAGPLGGKVVLDGNIAATGSIQGVPVSSDEREILYVAPGLTYQITTSTLLETAIRISLRGTNFPAGNQFVIGLFHTGTLWN